MGCYPDLRVTHRKVHTISILTMVPEPGYKCVTLTLTG